MLEKINIKANGADYEVDASKSVAELVAGFNLKPERCLVELNGKVFKFSDFENLKLHNGDVIEIMSLVAGG